MVWNAVSQNSYSVPTENGFPWGVLLATTITWLMPVGVYGLYSQISADSSGMITSLLLIAITSGIPVVALTLYLVDKRRKNGYISAWGYR